MVLSNVRVFSKSFDKASASAHVTIEGQIPTPGECDDPVVELFRPIRYQCVQDVFFTILVYHETDKIKCTILPSNRRNRTPKELTEVTQKAIEGDGDEDGILSQYVEILEKFFRDDNGLKLFLEKTTLVTRSESIAEESKYCKEANKVIKDFVRNNNLEMPSIKARKREIMQKLKK